MFRRITNKGLAILVAVTLSFLPLNQGCSMPTHTPAGPVHEDRHTPGGVLRAAKATPRTNNTYAAQRDRIGLWGNPANLGNASPYAAPMRPINPPLGDVSLPDSTRTHVWMEPKSLGDYYSGGG